MESTSPVSGATCFEASPLLIDFAMMGLPPFSRSLLRIGLTLLAFGMTCSGLSLLVLDLISMASASLVQNRVCLGLTTPAFGMTRYGSLPLILDSCFAGSLLPLRGPA